MVKAAGAVVACSEELGAVAKGLEDVMPELKKVDDFIRQRFLA
jgi:hypothetical protein